MTATLRAFLVNSSRALGIEPQHLKEPSAVDDVQTALLKDVIALRETGHADHSLALLDAAGEAGLTSDWIDDNRVRALLSLGREQEALPLLERLSGSEIEAVAVSANEFLQSISNIHRDLTDVDPEPTTKALDSVDHLFVNQYLSTSVIEKAQTFESKIKAFDFLFASVQDQNDCDFEILKSNLQNPSESDFLQAVLEQSIVLREAGRFQDSILILDCAWTSGLRSEWIVDNKVRGLLALGDLKQATSLLECLEPHESQENLRQSLSDHYREITKIQSYFADYANADFLRKRYFSLKNKQEYRSLGKPNASDDQCLSLAIKFRDNGKADQSLLVLLLTALDNDYNPWLEDNLARLACQFEDWISADRHWANIVSKSNDINAVETALESVKSLAASGNLEKQITIEKFGHLLFEESLLKLKQNNQDLFNSTEIASRFWAYDHSVDQHLTVEINQAIWNDFAGDDLRHAARYALRNKLYYGLSFLEAIAKDGGIKLSAMRSRCIEFIDQDYYFAQRLDLDPSRFDAFDHFLEFGWKEGSDPSAEFSCQQYLKSEDTCGLNPLYHFLCHELAVSHGSKKSSKIDKSDSLLDEFGQGVLLYDNTIHQSTQSLAAEHFQDSPYFDPAKLWLVQSNPGDYSSLRVHFVIPDFSKGGGGHMTIFRMIRHLEEKGHTVCIWVINPLRSNHSADLREDVVKYFQPVRAKVLPLDSSFHYASGDCIVATSWQTVDYVKNSKGFRSHYYFIQDYEPYFYARGTSAVLAEQTYQYDLACICASPWLDQLMKEKFQRWSRFLWLAYDHNIYKTSEDQITEKYLKQDLDAQTVHIAVYARTHTERRCVELALESLEQLAKLTSNFVVHFFGDDNLDISPSYKAVNYGILDHEQLSALYQFCTIGLSFSATNYSLLPQEMMAVGLPVFDLDVESTRAIYPKNVIQLMEPSPQAIASTLHQYCRDPKRLLQQALCAFEWVVQFSWDRAGDDFEKALIERLSEESGRQAINNYSIEKVHQGSRSLADRPYKASIVIPTYNAGPLLETVLDAIATQQTPWDFQCVIIDSGSRDETLEICKQFTDRISALDLYKIPKGDFQHGYTRNIGVDLSHSEYVAFITQDAIPANDKWLYNLVNALISSPNAAGAFGRHIAHDGSNAFITQELKNHFNGFDQLPVVMSITTDRQLVINDDSGWRKILHFYSDNNSCLRKSVWKSLPLPCVPYGEDQLWADMLIRNGYEKLYVKDAVVKHSHDYDRYETFDRSATESEFFSSCFGYNFHQSKQSCYKGISRDLQNVLKEGVQYDCKDEQMQVRSANVYAKHFGWMQGVNA